jgi:Copper type II ascorbate-dependent monooxygenase, C-terminal domain
MLRHFLTGKVVSGYKVTTDSNGQNTWTLLGKRDPNTPQMFYPIEVNVTVGYGDTLVFLLRDCLTLDFATISLFAGCSVYDVQ